MHTFDIEVKPDMKTAKYLPEPKVKYGNTKDPEKRKVMDEDAVMKQIKNMIFNPLTAKVVCYSVVLNQDVVSKGVVEEDGNEYDFIDKVFSFMRLGRVENPNICTYNGNNFDIPFLYKRALVYDRIINIGKKAYTPLLRDLPPMNFWTKRYATEPHCDIQEVWASWQTDKRERLEDVSSLLLKKHKIEVDHAKPLETEADKKLLLEHCVQDTLLTDEIYHLCNGILF